MKIQRNWQHRLHKTR